MCLVSIAFGVHPDYPLILAGNRDEYHARPSAAADWWEDQPDILGGRDLEAGGSWLAASKRGFISVVTNRPDLPPPDKDALSRGRLVQDGVTAPTSGTIDELPTMHHRYGGFSLVIATSRTLSLYTGGNGTGFQNHIHKPGVIGLSNTAIAQPWPKVNWLTQEIHRLIAAGNSGAGELMNLLSREEPVPASTSHGVPATPFIVGDTYGTRCSTVIMLDRSGSCLFQERRYGPGGTSLGESEFCFETPG